MSNTHEFNQEAGKNGGEFALTYSDASPEVKKEADALAVEFEKALTISWPKQTRYALP